MTLFARWATGFLMAAVAVAGTSTHLSAQQRPPATASPPAAMPAPPSGQALEAPVVRFPAEGVGLEEAVRLTLQHDPNLRRQEASVQFQGGVVQEQAGPFDYTWLSNVQYQNRIQELTEARKLEERTKRQRLDDSIIAGKEPTASAQKLLPLLDRLRTAAPGQEPLAEIRAVDPTMADTLQLFNDLIRNTSDAAQRQTLVTARSDFVNTTLGTELKNSLNDMIAAYNSLIVDRTNLGDSPVDETFKNGSFQIQLSKLFRNGIQFQPFLDGNIDAANFRDKPRLELFGGKGIKDLYTFHTGAGVLFPLMRGRGATGVAAFEKAARIELDARRLSAQHQASASALATILAYWDLRAAQDAFAIVGQSAQLQADLLRLTQQLIDAGELARAEISRAQAADARARAQREDAQRQVHQARVALATAIGVAATEDAATLPLARDAFPPTPDAAAVQNAAVLAGTAPRQRLDLSAAVKQQEAGRVLQEGVATNLRPRLDLTTSTWYTALEEDSIRRAIDRWVGPSTQISLQLERPTGNNLFRGQLVEREADTRSREIAATDLQRQIRLGVVQAASTLPDAVAQVQQAEAAVGFYRNIYDADVARFRTGEATLIDTVITQQQQTETMLSLIAARAQLARLVAQLRFQTGTLLGPGNTVDRASLVTVPAAGRNPQ